MLNIKTCYLNVEGQSLLNLFESLTNDLYSNDLIDSKSDVLKGLIEREQISSTLFENNVGMPHASSESIREPLIVLVTSKDGIVYENGEKANILTFVLTPKESGQEHLAMISKLSSILLNEENLSTISSATAFEDIEELFNTNNNSPLHKAKDSKGLLIGVTGCAVGVAHTYLAADSLKKMAAELGYDMIVETNGSIGVENSPSDSQIEESLAVIIASDKAVETNRFIGTPLYQTNVKSAINDPKQLIEKALASPPYAGDGDEVASSPSNSGMGIYKHLMSGVSYMIPFVIVGGLFLAISLAFGGQETPGGLVIPEGSFWTFVFDVGIIGFTLMLPILAGYIAFSISGQAAIAPAMIGGWIANNPQYYDSEAGMGFIGAIIAGFLAGYLVKYIKKIKFPEMIKPLVPIMIIPLCATFIISFVFIYVLGAPVALIVSKFYALLESLSTGSWIILGIVIGAMQGFDYGGTLGKIAFLFGIAMISEGHPEFMGAQAMAIPVAPLGLGIATKFDRARKYFTQEDSANGTAALTMGLVGISEGAIPFAAKNPLVVIPATMIGSIVAAVLGFAFGITNPVPHGGPIILLLGVVNKPLIGLLCMIIGSIVTAALVIAFMKIQMNRKQ